MSKANTKRRHVRLPIFHVNGTVSMPLANWPEPAILDAADYQMIGEMGYGAHWYNHTDGKGRRYVRASAPKLPGTLVSIARLIKGAKAGEVVGYHDDNRLNLRRSNLYIKAGKAKYFTVEAARAAAE